MISRQKSKPRMVFVDDLHNEFAPGVRCEESSIKEEKVSRISTAATVDPRTTPRHHLKSFILVSESQYARLRMSSGKIQSI